MLRAHAGTVPSGELAAMVGHTRMATQTKMHVLGIRGCSSGRPRGWTAAQLDALRAKPVEMSARAFAELHGLERKTVQNVARRLGIARWRKFTGEDEARIREMAPTHTAREIAEALGKPARAVQQKASAMGVRFTSGKRGLRKRASGEKPPKVYVKPRWSAEDDAALRELAGVSGVQYLAERLGRTEGSVRKRLEHLGVRARREARVKATAPVRARKGGVALRREEPKRVRMGSAAATCMEWCVCGAPVSNWDEHYERMGHRRPAAPARVA
jgi:hypothetical protein